MTAENMQGENELKGAVREVYDAAMPTKVQEKLDKTYASLDAIAQDQVDGVEAKEEGDQRHREVMRRAAPPHRASPHGGAPKKRVVRRGMVIAVAAVMVALFGGSAFALSRLLEMQPGDAPFFDAGANLPIYSSLQTGASSLQAPVGDTIEADGMNVTLDSVSCDRNIVNLFFTLDKEGGFDLAAQSVYSGSHENDWMRLQRLVPSFRYTMTSAGEQVGTGGVNVLDAYMEDGKVKCMMRIVPESTLPDQVDIALHDSHAVDPNTGEENQPASFDVGLDLSTVAQPRELGSQDVTFPTSEGAKTLGIERFTASELGTVMVIRNDSVWTGDPGKAGSSYGPSADVISPQGVKITDDKGNVLHFVGAGDGMGYDLNGSTVVELSGLASDATSVTFTPMVQTEAARKGDGPYNDPDAIAARNALNEQNEKQADVSHIGAKLPTSEYGGYEIADWSVANNTVSIKLKPYGWVPDGLHGSFELIPVDDVTYLAEQWTDPATGETGTGYHSAICYSKYDYRTGDLMQIASYYAATDDELKGLTQYKYHTMFGYSTEDDDAAQTLTFTG